MGVGRLIRRSPAGDVAEFQHQIVARVIHGSEAPGGLPPQQPDMDEPESGRPDRHLKRLVRSFGHIHPIPPGQLQRAGHRQQVGPVQHQPAGAVAAAVRGQPLLVFPIERPVERQQPRPVQAAFEKAVGERRPAGVGLQLEAQRPGGGDGAVHRKILAQPGIGFPAVHLLPRRWIGKVAVQPRVRHHGGQERRQQTDRHPAPPPADGEGRGQRVAERGRQERQSERRRHVFEADKQQRGQPVPNRRHNQERIARPRRPPPYPDSGQRGHRRRQIEPALLGEGGEQIQGLQLVHDPSVQIGLVQRHTARSQPSDHPGPEDGHHGKARRHQQGDNGAESRPAVCCSDPYTEGAGAAGPQHQVHGRRQQRRQEEQQVIRRPRPVEIAGNPRRGGARDAGQQDGQSARPALRQPVGGHRGADAERRQGWKQPPGACAKRMDQGGDNQPYRLSST